MSTFNDINIPYGSQVVSIGGVSFVAENISLSVPTQVIERRDETGNPSGQVLIEQFTTGSAVLQLATTLTIPPTNGATFTLTRNGGATVGCVISQVSEPETQMDAKKVNVNFRKRYGS